MPTASSRPCSKTRSSAGPPPSRFPRMATSTSPAMLYRTSSSIAAPRSSSAVRITYTGSDRSRARLESRWRRRAFGNRKTSRPRSGRTPSARARLRIAFHICQIVGFPCFDSTIISFGFQNSGYPRAARAARSHGRAHFVFGVSIQGKRKS